MQSLSIVDRARGGPERAGPKDKQAARGPRAISSRWMKRALRFACALVAMAMIAAPPAARAEDTDHPVASNVQLAGDGTRTRLLADLSEPVEPATFVLADPYRVVVDLPQVTFDLPADMGRDGRGLISAFRYGLVAPGKSRIVIDATGPVAVDKAFVLDPVDGQPARLVIDLIASDRAGVLAATRQSDDGADGSSQGTSPPQTDAVFDPLAPVPPGGGFERRPVIVLDPGHGGVDPGALSRGGLREKDIVLTFALRLAEALRATGKVDVEMTRDDDRFIPLRDRVAFGRDKGASLFVSLHADSISVANVRGATIYTLSERASDVEAARLAEKENRADAIAGLDLSEEPDQVAGILIDLVRRETQNFSVIFARRVMDDLGAATRLNKNPIRSAGFRVLRAPDVPSVLLELGYITNAEDVELMLSEDWQDGVAQAMVDAIIGYFAPRATHGSLAGQ